MDQGAKAPCPARRVADVTQGRDSAIHEAAERGWSYRQIAEATGLSHQRVGQIVNDGQAAARGSKSSVNP